MKFVIWSFLLLFVALLGFLALAVGSTYFNRSIKTIFTKSEASPVGSEASELTVMTWNLGYSGLGEESDFKADGGEMLLPPSKEVVEKNLAGITKTLVSHPADIYLLQETAGAGLLTRGVDMRSEVARTLAGWSVFFSYDISTRLFPSALRLEHGPATFNRLSDQSPSIVRLPSEPEPILGFIPRHYHMQVSELEVAGDPWVIINLHLAAFDDGADTRFEQLNEVIRVAQSYYEQGKAVAIGGDWNMRLTETSFPSTSTDDALFWIHDFPKNMLPEGWKLAFDAETPTVRTNERPFRVDENYRTIIDGLLVSPNVEVSSAKGVNLEFVYTDHQPVVFKLRKAN